VKVHMVASILADILHEAVIRSLANHPEGIGRMQLQKESGAARMSPYEFRKVLTKLKSLGLLREEGSTKGRLYFAPGLPKADSVAGGWDFSIEGRRAVAMVDCPRYQRASCTYDRGFLDAYVPNQTFYLREGDREQLAMLGRTPDARQPAGTHVRKIMERLLIDLSWNSSRLEGNTYSLLETENLIREGAVPGGKDAQETQMVLNHKHAIEFLVEGAEDLTCRSWPSGPCMGPSPKT